MTKRKKQPNVLRARGLVAYVGALPRDGWRASGETPLEAVKWFCAYRTAQGMFEDTVRHQAQGIQAGDYRPYDSLARVQEFLDGYDEDSKDELIKSVREFWAPEPSPHRSGRT